MQLAISGGFQSLLREVDLALYGPSFILLAFQKDRGNFATQGSMPRFMWVIVSTFR
jgi:hypothetical protein